MTKFYQSPVFWLSFFLVLLTLKILGKTSKSLVSNTKIKLLATPSKPSCRDWHLMMTQFRKELENSSTLSNRNQIKVDQKAYSKRCQSIKQQQTDAENGKKIQQQKDKEQTEYENNLKHISYKIKKEETKANKRIGI
jgi:hypothetical protein